MCRITIKTDDLRKKDLEEIKRLSPDRLYIWGNGFYRRCIEEYLRSVGGYEGELVTIVDDAYERPGETDAIPFTAFLRLADKETPLVFGFYNYPAIQEKREKWSSVIPNMYEFHLTVVNGKILPWDASKAKAREEAYQRTCERMGDARSRRVMQLYLNAATAGEFHALFHECYEPTAYFNRITKDLKIDTLIDCGAFDGDSIHDFVSVFPEYRRIIAIEPDPLNAGKLRKREKAEGIRNLTVIQKGLGAHRSSCRFQVNGESNSCLNEDGALEIEVTTLDDVLSGMPDDCGTVFLKMDIEGSELNALHGAGRFIREKTPVLAISVYHREEDLIEIPRLICEIAHEGTYDFFLGFHGLDLAELVLYGIPRPAAEDMDNPAIGNGKLKGGVYGVQRKN